MAAATPEEVIERIRRTRQRWVELDEPPRRALLVRRPGDLSLQRTYTRLGKLDIHSLNDITLDAVVGWRGFTEADIVGASVGSSDPQPFSNAVFREWVEDCVEELAKARAALVELIEIRNASKDPGKNSGAS